MAHRGCGPWLSHLGLAAEQHARWGAAAAASDDDADIGNPCDGRLLPWSDLHATAACQQVLVSALSQNRRSKPLQRGVITTPVDEVGSDDA